MSIRPTYPTALSACDASLGPGWAAYIQKDRGAASVLVLTSGDQVAGCLTTASDASRTDFGNTTSWVGRHPTPSPPVLSYLTSLGPPDTIVFAGRVPPAATAVRISFTDGRVADATLGSDLWLVWLDRPGKPVRLDALDASGTAISSITNPSDPDGILVPTQ